jgi:hypothetical protein
MKNLKIFIVSVITLFSVTIFLTIQISINLNRYADKKREIAEVLNGEERLSNLWEWVPFSGVGDEKVEKWRDLEKQGGGYYSRALTYSYFLIGSVLLFAAINFFGYLNSPERKRVYGLALVCSALCFLYIGLQSPFLEIEAFKDDVAARIPIKTDLFGLEIDDELSVAVEGRVYFMYQNKSIMQLISLLYNSGSYIIAGIIVFFSLIFPITKLVSSIFVFLTPGSEFSRKAIIVIEKLGKWSMADVFVVSIFLAYFSFANMQTGVDTNATTLVGLYFFLAFVILSILSGVFLKKVVIEASNQKNIGG